MSRRTKATAIFSVVAFGALLWSVFAEPEFWTQAFGPTAFGLPTPAVAGIVVTVLSLPGPWFAWHGMGIVLRGQDLGMPLGTLGILRMFLTVGHRIPELRRAQFIVAGGFLYFLALMVAWIWYADAHGL